MIGRGREKGIVCLLKDEKGKEEVQKGTEELAELEEVRYDGVNVGRRGGRTKEDRSGELKRSGVRKKGDM